MFEVTKITKATQQSLAQATSLIQQSLTGQQQTNAQTAVDNVAKKKWLARPSAASRYAMADCKGYKAPKTSTTTAPTTTPSTTTTG